MAYKEYLFHLINEGNASIYGCTFGELLGGQLFGWGNLEFTEYETVGWGREDEVVVIEMVDSERLRETIRVLFVILGEYAPRCEYKALIDRSAFNPFVVLVVLRVAPVVAEICEDEFTVTTFEVSVLSVGIAILCILH